MWEGGHRVPFLVSWPAKVKPGQWANQTICLTDMLATAAALTKQKMDSQTGEDSFNFLPVLETSGYTKPVRKSIINHSIDGTFAIREGGWKFIDSYGSGGWSMQTEKQVSEPGQLYDMEKDPGETINLYHKYPHIVKRLKTLLDKQKEQGYSRNISLGR